MSPGARRTRAQGGLGRWNHGFLSTPDPLPLSESALLSGSRCLHSTPFPHGKGASVLTAFTVCALRPCKQAHKDRATFVPILQVRKRRLHGLEDTAMHKFTRLESCMTGLCLARFSPLHHVLLKARPAWRGAQVSRCAARHTQSSALRCSCRRDLSLLRQVLCPTPSPSPSTGNTAACFWFPSLQGSASTDRPALLSSTHPELGLL